MCFLSRLVIHNMPIPKPNMREQRNYRRYKRENTAFTFRGALRKLFGTSYPYRPGPNLGSAANEAKRAHLNEFSHIEYAATDFVTAGAGKYGRICLIDTPSVRVDLLVANTNGAVKIPNFEYNFIIDCDVAFKAIPFLVSYEPGAGLSDGDVTIPFCPREEIEALSTANADMSIKFFDTVLPRAIDSSEFQCQFNIDLTETMNAYADMQSSGEITGDTTPVIELGLCLISPVAARTFNVRTFWDYDHFTVPRL
jgi:hypothetical protein